MSAQLSLLPHSQKDLWWMYCIFVLGQAKVKCYHLSWKFLEYTTCMELSCMLVCVTAWHVNIICYSCLILCLHPRNVPVIMNTPICNCYGGASKVEYLDMQVQWRCIKVESLRTTLGVGYTNLTMPRCAWDCSRPILFPQRGNSDLNCFGCSPFLSCFWCRLRVSCVPMLFVYKPWEWTVCPCWTVRNTINRTQDIVY